MAKPSEELLDLIFFALDHGAKSILKTDGPLIPFAITESGSGDQTLARFDTGRNPDEARQHARAHVAQMGDWTKYAIAGCGTLTENGQRTAVIMVEAGQRS